MGWPALAVVATLTVGAPAPSSHESSAVLDGYARPGRLVALPGGRRLNLRCAGEGAPVVVLEAGLGWGSLSWRKLQPGLSAITRTCAYDRAGLGFSDPVPGHRGPAAVNRDLRTMLKSSGESGPYVLVGHSYGGLSARRFAETYRDDVAGLVLVDPVTPGQSREFAKIAPTIGESDRLAVGRERACYRQLARRALTAAEAERLNCIDTPDKSFPPLLQARLRTERLGEAGSSETHREWRALQIEGSRPDPRPRGALGGLPLIVLTAGQSFAAQPLPAQVRARLLDRWQALHDELAGLSSVGEQHLVAGAGHVIQVEQPSAVVTALEAVVAEVRRRTGITPPEPLADRPPPRSGPGPSPARTSEAGPPP